MGKIERKEEDTGLEQRLIPSVHMTSHFPRRICLHTLTRGSQANVAPRFLEVTAVCLLCRKTLLEKRNGDSVFLCSSGCLSFVLEVDFPITIWEHL